MKQFNDYFSYNSFFGLLKDTELYKDTYKSFAGRISICLSLLGTYILTKYYEFNGFAFYKKIDEVVATFTPGLFGLLGIYIAGVSLVISMPSKRTIENLDKQKKVDALVKMFFAYYFAGASLLVTIIGFITLHFREAIFMIYKELSTKYSCLALIDGANVYLVALFSLIGTYIFFFSLLYTVSLLGVCINVFFANIYMDREFEKEKRKQENERIHMVIIREHD